MKRENELRVGSRKKRPDKDEEERRIQKAFREVAQKAKIAINGASRTCNPRKNLNLKIQGLLS